MSHNTDTSNFEHEINFTITGPNKANVLTQLMNTLAAELAQGQIVQYRAVRSLSVAGVLSVGIVIATPSVAVVKDLLLTCTHLGLEMTYKITGVTSSPTASPSNGSDYVLTILSPHSHVPATCYRDFCQVLSNFQVNITKIINLSDKNNTKKSSAVEFVVNVPAECDLSAFKGALLQVGRRHFSDIAVQAESLLRRKKRMVVFDMNNTLIQTFDLLEYLGDKIGVLDKMKAIRASYGDKNFTSSITERVALLKGVSTKLLEGVEEHIKFTKGALFLCRALKKLGFKLACISSGFDVISKAVKEELGLDYAFHNTLETEMTPEGEVFTGKLEMPIVDGIRKMDLLTYLTEKEGISPEACICIGDGPVSWGMIALAGLGIAFDATPQNYNTHLNLLHCEKDLSDTLYLLGYPKHIWSEETKDKTQPRRTKRSISTEEEIETVIENPSNTRQYKRSIVTVTGPDGPGVLYSLCEIVATSHAHIVDIRQFVLQQNLLLVVLLEYDENSNDQVLKELLFKVKRMPGMDMDFELLDQSNNESLERQASSHAITVINSRMTFKFLAEFCKLIEARGCVIREINRLSEAKADKNKKRYGEEDEEAFVHELECLEFVVDLPSSSEEDLSRIKAELMSMAKEFNTDIALQAEGLVRKIKRLVVFDMDSTLIQQECIDEMAVYAGVEQQVKDITRRAMNGELDFEQSLRQRVGLLRGVSAEIIPHIVAAIQYTPGAKFLCKTLKKMGYKLAVISGGFTHIIKHVKDKLNLDYSFANTLEIRDGKLTGQLLGPIVDARKKADLLDLIAQEEGIPHDQVIAIGDGANDLLMLSRAGLGIAFNAKPKVQEAAKFRINQASLATLIYFLGISDRSVDSF
eukprot:TRINITY_DN9483_c0_g1_i1.p1 TRINITY_DN9483_c0_g1~~TRINITY_DN9483_c0_g1_i1.p1  ORF type:complete len:864 (-),score=324.54 TRINITY_DN9483_c0_g1_i1:22-2613(-)